jgi:hypothetical protein
MYYQNSNRLSGTLRLLSADPEELAIALQRRWCTSLGGIVWERTSSRQLRLVIGAVERRISKCVQAVKRWGKETRPFILHVAIDSGE